MVAVVAYDATTCPARFFDRFTAKAAECHCLQYNCAALAWLKHHVASLPLAANTSVHVKLHQKSGVRRRYRVEVFVLSPSGVLRRFAESDAFADPDDVLRHMQAALHSAFQKLCTPSI